MNKILRVLLWIGGGIIVVLAVFVGSLYVIFPKTGPAPDIKVDSTAERIERGKYLANHVAGCVDCHSDLDQTRYSMPPKDGTLGQGGFSWGADEGMPAGLVINAPNITPANLGTWTDGEILRAMTGGVDRDGHALFPVMPYKNFSTMDTEDAYDIIAYLRSLPPIQNTVAPDIEDFPWPLITRTIPVKPAPTKKPSPADKVAYGSYLVDMGRCRLCHTQRDDHGNPLPGLDLAGGQQMYFSMKANKWVKSANLTPDKTGLGDWTEAMFVGRFKAFDNAAAQHKTLAPGAQQTYMPWIAFSGMKDDDLKAIFAYLKTVPPVANKVQSFP